jgi:transketolase
MRRAFIRTLVELAEQDSRVLLLVGDLGFMTVEPFVQRFPSRFFNIGIAEQNMMGVATGLAEAGYLPFAYSIVPFAVLRPYEFIRQGPILHKLPVRIVGVGGGVEYGPEGATHYGLEDVGVLRVQPGITTIAPADHEQARTALQASWNLPGPVYYRLGKDDETTIPGLSGAFSLGRAQLVRDGTDVLLVAMGNVATEAAKAAQLLDAEHISCALIIVASVSPRPTRDLLDALSRFPVVLTVEEHYITGGVGSLVSEIVAEHGLACRVVRCGVKDTPDGVTGSHAYMRRRCLISSEALVQTAVVALRDHARKEG